MHGASNEPEAYLEPIQLLGGSVFGKIVNNYKSLTVFAKKLHHDIWHCSKYTSVNIILHLTFLKEHRKFIER